MLNSEDKENSGEQKIYLDGAMLSYDPDSEILTTSCLECGEELSKNIGKEYVVYAKKKIAVHREKAH